MRYCILHMQYEEQLWKESLRRLAKLVASGRVTQAQVAAAAGVDQSQVSRILAGRCTRLSTNVERLCRLEHAMRSRSTLSDAHLRKPIDAAIAAVWDGSSAHASAIAEVVLSLGPLQSTFNRNRSGSR